MTALVRVIGCGNPDAGDDAVGLLAVRKARGALESIPGVEVVEAGMGLHVLDLLDDVGAVLVVDGVRSPNGSRPPGEIVRVEAGPGGLPAGVGSSLSSHGFGLGEALGLAATIGRAPRVVFLGVEIEDVAAGDPLSPTVAAALDELVRRVVDEAGKLSR